MMPPKKVEKAIKFFEQLADTESFSMDAQCVNTASNVRSCAGTGCGVLVTLPQGSGVNVIGDGGYNNGYKFNYFLFDKNSFFLTINHV